MRGLATILFALLLFCSPVVFGATHQVEMRGSRFIPATLNVQVGDTVTWVNFDFSGHDTVHGRNGVPGGAWRSPLFGRNGSFSFTFNVAPGEYPYYCTPHVAIGMVGTINVAEAVNTPPTVTITSPANNTTFNEPATFPVQASASDADGIAQVEFFNGGTSLGVDTSAPYSANVSSLPEGTYNLSAVARDNRGGTASHAISVTVTRRPNTQPSIRIVAPATTNFVAPAIVQMLAEASDAEGISRVEFFVDGALQETDTTSPYSATLTIPLPGNYVLSADVIDTDGARIRDNLAIFVDEPPRGTLLVAITSPTNGQEFVIGSEIAIRAAATNELASITRVDFYVGSLLRATDVSFPYEAVLNDLSLGEHTVTAIARDAREQISSNSVTIFIREPANIPPTVSIRSPEGGPFQGQQRVSFTVSFSDPDGAISNITFKANNDPQVVRVTPVSPQTYEVILLSGTNTFVATVTDDRGAKATNTLTVMAGENSAEIDIIFRTPSGALELWRVASAGVVAKVPIQGAPVPPADYRYVTRSDLDGNGKPELMWQRDNGIIVLWHLDGARFIREEVRDDLIQFGRPWKAVGAGDLNGDRVQEVIFHHEMGYVFAYFINDPDRSDFVADLIVPANWRLASVVDETGDGHDEISWQLPDGTVNRWWIFNGYMTASAANSPPMSSRLAASFIGTNGGARFLLQDNDGTLRVTYPGLRIIVPGLFPITEKAPIGWQAIAISLSTPSMQRPIVTFPGSTNLPVGINSIIAKVQDKSARIVSVQFSLQGPGTSNFLGEAQFISMLSSGESTFSLPVNFPGEGLYRLTAVARNSSGQKGTNSVSINVLPPATMQFEGGFTGNSGGSLSIRMESLITNNYYEILRSVDLRTWEPAAQQFLATNRVQRREIFNQDPRMFYRLRRVSP